MHSKTKLFLSIFAILLIITVGEIIYYFMYLSPKNQQPIVNSNLQPSQTTVSSDPFAQQYISSYLSDLGSTLNEPVVGSVTLTTHFEGTIADIDPENGKITSEDGKEIAYAARIQLEKDNNTYTLLYNENNMKAIKIVDKTESKDISFKDLQKGDTIQIEQGVTFSKDPKQSKATTVITRL